MREDASGWKTSSTHLRLREKTKNQTMPAKSQPPRQSIITHHLIWTLYGHWLPNDLRGSGSAEIRDE
jgi:hypothetical protein